MCTNVTVNSTGLTPAGDCKHITEIINVTKGNRTLKKRITLFTEKSNCHAWTPPAPPQDYIKTFLGSFHGAEVPFVFYDTFELTVRPLPPHSLLILTIQRLELRSPGPICFHHA